MSESWYYVDKVQNERVGPISQEQLSVLLHDGDLDPDCYVWKKGFGDWTQIKNVNELQSSPSPDDNIEGPEGVSDNIGEVTETISHDFSMDSDVDVVDWNSLSIDHRCLLIKTGRDREEAGVEYGPFTLEELRKLYQEGRISGETFYFVPGMKSWQFLADLPVYEKVFGELPRKIHEDLRRQDIRKPFIARMFFHDHDKLYEGVCRDISIGGMQVLVSGFPGKVGEMISMNVHPDNSEFSFVAQGKIVRILNGQQGFSFRFVDLNEEAIKAISHYLIQEP